MTSNPALPRQGKTHGKNDCHGHCSQDFENTSHTAFGSIFDLPCYNAPDPDASPIVNPAIPSISHALELIPVHLNRIAALKLNGVYDARRILLELPPYAVFDHRNHRGFLTSSLNHASGVAQDDDVVSKSRHTPSFPCAVLSPPAPPPGSHPQSARRDCRRAARASKAAVSSRCAHICPCAFTPQPRGYPLRPALPASHECCFDQSMLPSSDDGLTSSHFP